MGSNSSNYFVDFSILIVRRLLESTDKNLHFTLSRGVSFWFRSREPRTQSGFRSWELRLDSVLKNGTHSNLLRKGSREAYECLIVL